MFIFYRNQNYYSYIIGKTYPTELRYIYFSYHAFYYEILRSRFISREESVIKTRLSYWENRLEEVVKFYNTSNIENKVVDKKSSYTDIIDPIEVGLKYSVLNSKIKIDTLFRIIDYQFFDLDKKSIIKDMEELEIYAENTRSLLLYLNLNLLKVNDSEAYVIASHVGRALGIIDVIKKTSTMLKIDINLMPRTLIDKYAGNYNLLIDRRGDVSENFYDIILEMAAYSKKHLEVARELYNKHKENINPNAYVAFLDAVEGSVYLDKLEEYNFNCNNVNLNKISTFKIPRLILKKGKSKEF